VAGQVVGLGESGALRADRDQPVVEQPVERRDIPGELGRL